MHVDKFIDKVTFDKNEAYAQFFFNLFRLPAYQKMAWDEWIKLFKLYCTYEDKRYRVTGCSTWGDIWLHSNLNWNEGKDKFYEKRVDIGKCSAWSQTK